MKMLSFTLALSLSIPAAALAHNAASGPHGGPIVESSGHHVEFIASDDQVIFYLTGEADEPIASTGAKGTAIIQQNGKTGTVRLEPTAPNILSGHIAAPIAVGARIVVSAKMSDGHAIQARFVKK